MTLHEIAEQKTRIGDVRTKAPLQDRKKVTAVTGQQVHSEIDG
jgi:hypothetical protein